MSRSNIPLIFRRALSSSTSLQKVNIAKARIPEAIHQKFQHQSIESSAKIPLEKDEVARRSKEFWKILQAESSHDEDARNMIAAIKSFSRGFKEASGAQLLVIENLFAAADPEKSKREISKRVINGNRIAINGEVYSQRSPSKTLKEQASNVEIIQIIYWLSGLKIIDPDDVPRGFSPLIIVEGLDSQEPHCDGPLEKGAAKSSLRIKANALMPVDVKKESTISTNFIYVNDVVEKLSPESLKILQENRFRSGDDSSSAHPILKLEGDLWTIIYPEGKEFIRKTDIGAEKAFDEFKTIIAEMEKDKIHSHILVSVEGKPNEFLMYNNPSLVHYRRNPDKSTDYRAVLAAVAEFDDNSSSDVVEHPTAAPLLAPTITPQKQ